MRNTPKFYIMCQHWTFVLTEKFKCIPIIISHDSQSHILVSGQPHPIFWCLCRKTTCCLSVFDRRILLRYEAAFSATGKSSHHPKQKCWKKLGLTDPCPCTTCCMYAMYMWLRRDWHFQSKHHELQRTFVYTRQFLGFNHFWMGRRF